MTSLKNFRIFTLIILSFCFGMTVSFLKAMKRGFNALEKQAQQLNRAELNSNNDHNDDVKLLKKIKTKEDCESTFLVPVLLDSQPKKDSTSVETTTSLLSSTSTASTSTAILTTASSSSNAIILGKRPASVQAICDKKFEEIKDIISSKWGDDGSHGAYGILGLNDELVLKNLVFKQGKKDIYIIDLGCALGGWGNFAMQVLLNDEICKKSEKHFNIFSITGGKECVIKVINKNNVTHYLFNQVKIENIDEELSKRGFDLKNKVDLIVSHCTLQHLVDPFGTFKCMYELLTSGGLLLSNGFFFAFDGSEDVKKFPFDTNWNLLANTNIAALFRVNDNLGREAGEFMLMKTNDQELSIPIDYENNVIPLSIESEYQFFSRVLTVFKRGDIKQAELFTFDETGMDGSFGYYPCYCDKNNKSSINLYKYLKSKKLFIWQSDTK